MTEEIRAESEMPQGDYWERMNKAWKEKMELLRECFVGLRDGGSGQVVMSVGAGGAWLERGIKTKFPNVRVVAVDRALSMLRGVVAENTEEVVIYPVQADGLEVPVGEVDVEVVSGVLHEVGDREVMVQMVAEWLGHLKVGGRLGIRDFIEDAQEGEVVMRVGKKQEGDRMMEPVEFVKRFAEEYEEGGLGYLREQVQRLESKGEWKVGAKVRLKRQDWVNLAAHFSWSDKFEAEVREKYTHYTLKGLGELIEEAAEKVGVEVNVVDARSELTQGYVDHIEGRLDFESEEGEKLEMPDFMGAVVVELTRKAS